MQESKGSLNNLLELARMLVVLENDIASLSEKKIKAEDIFPQNIMISKDGFKLIDTLDYSFSRLSKDELYEENLKRIIRDIYTWLFKGFTNAYTLAFNDYLKIDPSLKPSENVTAMQAFLSNQCNHEIENINEAESILVRRK